MIRPWLQLAAQLKMKGGWPMERVAWLKRQLRRLRRQEQAIRFGEVGKGEGRPLVWDGFFGLAAGRSDCKYPWLRLLAMDEPQFEQAVDEFFCEVYYRFYSERACCRPQSMIRLTWRKWASRHTLVTPM